MDILYAQGNGAPGGGFLGLLPFILIIFVIYFLMIRPQMKQQRKKREMLEKLKKGDRVITSGGVYGTIAGFKNKDSVVVLSVDKNVALQVSKSAISALADRGKETGDN